MAARKRGLRAAGAETRRPTDETALALVEKMVGTSADAGAEEEVSVSLAQVTSAWWQPRKDYEADAIETLADSIERDGLLQPPLVRPHETDGEVAYQTIFGHRRMLALRRVAERHGIAPTEYAFRARVRRCSEVEAQILTAVENAFRRDLRPYEMAVAVQTVWAALHASGLPHTDRDIAPLFNLKSAGTVNEYRQIANAVDEDVLRAAGLVREDYGIDWSTVGELKKEELLRAAKATTTARRVSQLARIAERKRQAGRVKEQAEPDTAEPKGPRFTVDGLRKHGGFAVKLSKPFASYLREESERFLADILPAVAALAQNLVPGGGRRHFERTDSGLLAYVHGRGDRMRSTEVLDFLAAIQSTMDDLQAEIDAAFSGRAGGDSDGGAHQVPPAT